MCGDRSANRPRVQSSRKSEFKQTVYHGAGSVINSVLHEWLRATKSAKWKRIVNVLRERFMIGEPGQEPVDGVADWTKQASCFSCCSRIAHEWVKISGPFLEPRALLMFLFLTRFHLFLFILQDIEKFVKNDSTIGTAAAFTNYDENGFLDEDDVADGRCYS